MFDTDASNDEHLFLTLCFLKLGPFQGFLSAAGTAVPSSAPSAL